MGDNNPNPPVTPPTSDAGEEQRFQNWFEKYLKSHEPNSDTDSRSKPVSSGTGEDTQQGFSLETAIERVLSNRERRQNQQKKVTDLEQSNTDLAERVKKLEDAAKTKVRDIFSIFG